MNCNEAVAALVASLENGTPMTDEQRTHIQTCERCRELLHSAKQFQNELAGNGIEVPPVDATLAAAEEETRRSQRRRAVRAFIGLFAVVSALIFVLPGATVQERLMILAATMVISALLAIPIVLVMKLARGNGKQKLYRRLKPGHMIAGVCLGISEATNVNVTLLRLIFVAVLLIGKGVGFWLYLLFDLAMPVHPDDRQYMLRFRLRRWWERRTAHANDHAR